MTRTGWVAFAALCLLAGSTWMLDAALPAALPGSLAFLVDSVLLALVIFCSARRLPAGALSIFVCSAVILAIPVALASLCDGRLSSTTIVLIYTLVPVATVFFAAQASQDDLLRLLGPALAGIAGAALILPFALPASRAGALWLAAMLISALAAGFAALRLHTLLQGQAVLPAAGLGATASAIVALPLYALQRPQIVLLTWQQVVLSEAVHLGFEAAILLLTIRLTRDLGAIAFASRYLLIPLVTIAEGYAILRPSATWTFWAGILMLAGGSAALLRAEHQG